MFDIGGWEFMVIVVLAIIIIGPKDLPGAIRSVTQWVRKARALARDFQSGLDDIANEVELDKVKEGIVNKIDGGGIKDTADTIRRDIEDAIDPDDEIRSAFAGDDYFDEPGDAVELLDDEDEIRCTAERKKLTAEAPGEKAEDAAEKPADEAQATAARTGTGT
jgi:sec-independent protein translocase protein TatB